MQSALAIASYIRGTSYEDKAKRRLEMLKTTSDDLLHVADLLDRVNEDSGVCIVGGKEILNSCKEKITSFIEI